MISNPGLNDLKGKKTIMLHCFKIKIVIINLLVKDPFYEILFIEWW